MLLSQVSECTNSRAVSNIVPKLKPWIGKQRQEAVQRSNPSTIHITQARQTIALLGSHVLKVAIIPCKKHICNTSCSCEHAPHYSCCILCLSYTAIHASTTAETPPLAGVEGGALADGYVGGPAGFCAGWLGLRGSPSRTISPSTMRTGPMPFQM